MNLNDYIIEEHEISIRKLFWKLLLQWKWIVLFACIFAVLGYGFAKYKQHYSNTVDDNVSIDENENQLIDFEVTEENVYEAVRKYEVALNNEQNYMENSLLMQLDPYHILYTIQEFEIKTQGNVDINQLNMIGRRLINSATSREVTTQLGEKYNCAPQYIKELISSGSRENLYDQSKVNITTAEPDSGSAYILDDNGIESYYFFISAKSNDIGFSTEMVDFISDYVQMKSHEIGTIDFELKAYPSISFESMDIGVITSQNDSRARSYDYSDKLVRFYTVLDNLESNKGKSVEENVEQIVISGKKLAFIGFVLGGVLAIIFLALKSILSSVFQTEEEFRTWFKLNQLGTAPTLDARKKTNVLKKRIMGHIEGNNVCLSPELFYSMASVNIANSAQGCESILFTGSIKQDDMVKLENGIKDSLQKNGKGINCAFMEDILNNPETRATLMDKDGIVFVEKRNYSRIEDIKEEIEVVTSLGKKILGVVLL